MNTTENNRLIAEFLGLQLEQDQERLFINGLGTKLINETFNTDWNWLMEVVEKIESLNHWVEIAGGIENICLIGSINSSCESFKIIAETKIESVYNACVEFIKLYNQSNQ